MPLPRGIQVERSDTPLSPERIRKALKPGSLRCSASEELFVHTCQPLAYEIQHADMPGRFHCHGVSLPKFSRPCRINLQETATTVGTMLENI